MPTLSWNEIRSRALAFSCDWADAAHKDAVDKAYWPDGGRKRYAGFSERVAILFERHRAITSLLPVAPVKGRRR